MTEVQEDGNSVEAVKPERPLLRAPRNPETLYVENEEQLAEAVDLLAAGHGPFGVDAERASGFKYSQRAYLIQVNRAGAPIFLIDPWAISPALETEPFRHLARLLATDTWILHAASQDLPCLKQLGLEPTKLFDTELGSRLAGFERVGLGSVVENLLEMRLAKEHSAVDWSTRPLENDWLVYAALDVDVLQDLMAAISENLRGQGKSIWAQQEFDHLLKFQPKPANPEKWRSMAGLNEVRDAVGLAIARQLWHSREDLAKRLDVSPGRLVPDASLSLVAKVKPRSKPELAGLKGFYGRASRTYLDTWWQAVSEALKTRDLPPLRLAPTGIPNHRSWPGKFPEADLRLKAIRPALAALSESVKVPVENILSPELARAIAWDPPNSTSVDEISAFLSEQGARPWQVELVAPAIARALENAQQEETTAESSGPQEN